MAVLAARLAEGMEYVGAPLLRVWRQPKPLRQGVNMGDCHGDFCWWIGRPQLAPLSVMNAYLPRGSVGLEALGPWGPVLGPRQSLLFVGFFMQPNGSVCARIESHPGPT